MIFNTEILTLVFFASMAITFTREKKQALLSIAFSPHYWFWASGLKVGVKFDLTQILSIHFSNICR